MCREDVSGRCGVPVNAPLFTYSKERKVEAGCGVLCSCLMIDWSSMASLMKHKIEKQQGAGSGGAAVFLGSMGKAEDTF